MKKHAKAIAGLFLAIVMMIAGLASCANNAPTPGATTPTAPAQTGTQPATEDPTQADDTPAVNTDPIVFVWYPNESAAIYENARNTFGEMITRATGREVVHMLTTDYVIAIEAIASGSADIAAMGPIGYIQARDRNPLVNVLVVPSGNSGGLDDAVYYGWFAVRREDEDDFRVGDGWSVDNIIGRSISFVSPASTSGFVVPADFLIGYFADQFPGIDEDMILEPGAIFSDILMGMSHQGAAFNLLDGRADIATFCDTCVFAYMDLVYGEANMTGAIYAVRENAEPPFHNIPGMEFRLIHSIPVLNAPIAYNGTNLSPEEVAAIQAILTSDEASSNPFIFSPDGDVYAALWSQHSSGARRMLVVDDAWYNPLRGG
jgi:phosphonate transport system substrate-binding protein